MQVKAKHKLRGAAFAALVLLSGVLSTCAYTAGDSTPPLIEGIFWQPDSATTKPTGNWQKLGASTLVVQWLTVDHKAWYASNALPLWRQQPDWERIRTEPWAKSIVAGLSGSYSEKTARKYLNTFTDESLQIAQGHLPFKPSAYYFPIEPDPSWVDVTYLHDALERLPHPLWVSIYSADRNPLNYAIWVKSWLPAGVKVYFQDGVGTGVRTPDEARRIANELIETLGKDRVVILMETFRPVRNGFRSAYSWEIIRQLKAYDGLHIYAFDGPHYLSNWTVMLLQIWAQATGRLH